MSLAAEQSVVGACVIDNDAYWKISGIITAEDFTDPFLRECWVAITESANAGGVFDVITMNEQHDIPLQEITSLALNIPGSSNVVTYAKIVREQSKVRRAAVEVGNARERLLAGDEDAISDLQSKLEGLNRSDRPSTNFHDALKTGLDEIESAQNRSLANGGIVGAPTGIDLLDRRLGGLSGGKLVILCARPSLGKTALALQAAQSAAAAGFPVGILSLEMGAGELAVRAFAHQYQVNNTALAAGDRETVATLTERFSGDTDKMQRVKNLPIYIDEDTFTVGGMLGRIAEWSRKYQIKMVVIDHLQLVEVEKGFNRNDGLGEITRKLKICAKRLDIPIVLLCQLNRNVEREQRKPRLSDLRDSGNIEQDADIVMALHGPLESNQFGAREVEVGFLKFRGGLVGWAGQMLFNGPTQTFRRMAVGYGAE